MVNSLIHYQSHNGNWANLLFECQFWTFWRICYQVSYLEFIRQGAFIQFEPKFLKNSMPWTEGRSVPIYTNKIFYHFCFPQEQDIQWWTFENIYGTILAVTMSYCLKQGLKTQMPIAFIVIWMFEICQVEKYSSLMGGGKSTPYLFLKDEPFCVNFYFSHLWNR